MSSDADKKTCTRCRKVKPLADFPERTVRSVRRRSPRCADCLREVDRERQQRYRDTHADQFRAADREVKRRASARRIGVSPERAKELRKGPCGVCGRRPDEGCQLYQDATTGAVLGVLCHTCLRGLAMLGGTPDRLTAALAFVQSGKDLRDEEEPEAASSGL